MPFTVKDWRDFPDTSTPITAAALEDLEDRLADYTDYAAGPFFNVKHYGAVGDDSADDTAEVQAAITAANAAGGGTVLFPPGTYKITSSLNAVYSNITLRATQPRKATLKAYSGAASSWTPMLDMRATTQISNVALEGMILDANSIGMALGVGGVNGWRALNCQFKNCPVIGVGTVYVAGGDTGGPTGLAKTFNVEFNRCEIGPTADTGVCFLGGHNDGQNDEAFIENVRIIDCYVHDCDANGFHSNMYKLRQIRDIEFRGCYFDNNSLTSTVSFNGGHIIDFTRNGWVNIHVHHCTFLNTKGALGCGAFADHAGRAVKFTHNYVNLGHVTYGMTQWSIALGEDNDVGGTAIPFTQRTWDAEIAHNYFTNCGPFDYDSEVRTHIHHNVFFRCMGVPIAAFNHHFHDRIEDNWFVENGQGGGAHLFTIDARTPGVMEPYEVAGISTSAAGVEIRRNHFRDQQTGRATLTTAFAGTNNDLTFRAMDDGTGGNSFTVALVVSGTNTPLSVSMATNAITINVATNGAGAATSTARQVQVAVNSHPLVKRKIYANIATSNDGTGVVAALAATALSGGSTTLTQTQTVGIYEHDTGTGASWLPTQPKIAIFDNDFTNTVTPLANRRTVGTEHLHRISGNIGEAAATVASAATVTLPIHSDEIAVSGTTNITSITPDQTRTVTLRSTGTFTVVDGSNLRLNSDMLMATGDVLILSCQDGANWDEVSRVQAPVGVRTPVRAAATGNVNTASPGATHDGVTMATTTPRERLLLANQTTTSQNGIYDYNGSAVALTRSSDADTAAKLTSSLQVQVDEGTVNKDSIFTLVTNKPITVGTTALRFTRVHPAYAISSHPATTAFMPTNSKLENLDRTQVALSNQAALTTQIARVFPMGVVRAGDTLANINFVVATTASAGITNSWAGIARLSDRAVLAVSATSTATTAANTKKTFTFGSAYTADKDEIVVGFVMYQATTVPTLFGINQGNAVIFTEAPVVNGTSNTGATTPVAVAATLTAFTSDTELVYAWCE